WTQERQAARSAARRRQEVRASCRGRAAGSASTGAKGAPSDLQRNPRRRRVGDPGDLAGARGLPDRRRSRSLSPPMADRARLQALEESDRPEGTARRRRTLRQTLRPGPSLNHPSARAAHRRTRGLSPLGREPAPGRLTRPETWRLLRQLVASLLQAIMPEPTFACLQNRLAALYRHLREPPRKQRMYQGMVPIC